MSWAALSTRMSTSARAEVNASAVSPAASSRLEERKCMANPQLRTRRSIPRGRAGLWQTSVIPGRERSERTRNPGPHAVPVTLDSGSGPSGRPGMTTSSMLPGIHPVADDGGFAQRLGGFQPVQALDQHETLAVGAHLDRHLLAVLEHAGGDLVDARLHQRFAPLDRHVDLGDREILALEHGGATIARLCALRRPHRCAII